MPGTLDPITEGHLAAARLAIEKGDVDFVILTPSENPKKNPIPRAQRLQMVALAAENEPRILYAKNGDLYTLFRDESLLGIAKKIRKINPHAELDIVVGNEIAGSGFTSRIFNFAIRPQKWIIVRRKGETSNAVSSTVAKKPYVFVEGDTPEVSSSATKKFLLDHPELYEHPATGAAQISGLNKKVAEHILALGLYRTPPAQGSKLSCIVKKFLAKVMP
jgi:hypothetical protein